MNTPLRNVTVLVVDDDKDTRDVLGTILEQAGAHVIPAQSVDKALELFRRSPAHVVLTDISLGSSDGYALIEVIREYNKEYRGFTPAIAITGFVAPGDRERAIAAGFDAYIRKPFDPAEVVDVIAKLWRHSTDLAA